MIDFRSDTITKPTKLMLEAMFSAVVGDDVFGDDPTVTLLESKAAALFGMESAMFCASGTMANQIGIQLHTSIGGQVVCDELSHIYLYEGGGIAKNAGCSVKLLKGTNGMLTASLIESSLHNPDDIHFPVAQLVSLENTMNKGGGLCYDWDTILEISTLCKKHNLKLHLDGARLFNALVATGQSPQQYGEVFDTISICLSKGLGCPVGSILLGSKESISKARRIRKSMGGGWRQAGYLAAAGIYALDNHLDRLAEDHQRAKQLGASLNQCSFVKSVYPIETNIIIFEVSDTLTATEVVVKLKGHDILAVTFGKKLVRLVLHLDISEEDVIKAQKVFKTVSI